MYSLCGHLYLPLSLPVAGDRLDHLRSELSAQVTVEGLGQPEQGEHMAGRCVCESVYTADYDPDSNPD